MASLDLVGQAPAEINGKIAVTLMSFNVNESRPTTDKKGALGPIGVAQGIQDVSGSMTFAIPKTGAEVNLELIANQPGGFVLTYTTGANRYGVMGCVLSEVRTTVDNGAGNVEVSANFTATERVRLA